MTHAIEPSAFSAQVLPLLDEGASVPVAVTGRSMAPFLQEGRDAVLLARFDAARLRPGHIVLFARADGTPVLHRVVRVGADAFDAGGDSLDFLETGVPLANGMALAVVRIRGTKRLVLDAPLPLLFARTMAWILIVRDAALRIRHATTRRFGGI